ncbi:MAG: nucleoside recognition domain-containing protein [Acutalibacter sp.]|jgi:spore maturation protein A
MLNSIWFGMIALSVVCALATGNLGELSSALMDGAQAAVELSLALLGSMCAWLGFLRIAEESGLSRLIAKALSPVICRLFPEYKDAEDIQGKIAMNLSANLLGLGNAATPLGLAAMESMRERHPDRDSPTKGMILFVVMNTASLQLIPVNMAAMRASTGSTAPFSILPQVWVTSGAALVACMTCCKLLERSPLWRR